MGRSYDLVGGEDVPKVAQVVSDLLTSIRGVGPGLDNERLAVLACVHLACCLHSVEEKV